MSTNRREGMERREGKSKRGRGVEGAEEKGGEKRREGRVEGE